MQLDTVQYLNLLRQLTREGHEVRLQVSGNSMFPFLADGRDAVFFRSPDSPLRPGQIVFYQRPNGQFIMHRICRIHGGMLYLAGDAQTELEGPVDPSTVFARITKVFRKDRLLRPGMFLWGWYACPWRYLRPFRRPLIRLRCALSRLCRRRHF